MKNYEYARVSFYNKVEILSTDPKVVNWLFEELKKIVPSTEVFIDQKDLLGNTIMLQFHKLSNKDNAVFLWLKQKLCQNGWEPFAITQREHEMSEYVYFRFENTK